MKTQRYSVLFLVSVLAGVLSLQAPAHAVNRDIVELQTQVQQLQGQMTHMQQSVDERMGVLKSLMDQNTDSINKVTAAIGNLQITLTKQQGESGAHVDQISGQMQSLNDTLDELKARVEKIGKQLEEIQAGQQNLATPPAQPPQAQQPAAPPPDVLYNNALRDYSGGNNDLASQEFVQYIKTYGNTDLAGNCYFYLAEIAYRQKNYAEAAKDYDSVLQNFPSGNKAASAQLKKGFALLELGQKDAGVAELRHVAQRYPRSPEAMQARERLQKLGVSATTARRTE